ncbi:hypothetical protein GLX27_000351 [Malassezia furfur]|uniref:Heparinase II/III-like C-terminal domain-containing protein n=1 Tax=Malassezia furfur TaxID=55194 RepID=A0ABY8EJ12_MALFU|nr:hypothetical protein CBS14141_001968 [Malassezia furfur]WFD45727.1 hypothetical protein GLX27_000351 [Malassezia furfur]
MMSRANQGPYLGQQQGAYTHPSQVQQQYVQYAAHDGQGMTRYQDPGRAGYGYGGHQGQESIPLETYASSQRQGNPYAESSYALTPAGNGAYANERTTMLGQDKSGADLSQQMSIQSSRTNLAGPYNQKDVADAGIPAAKRSGKKRRWWLWPLLAIIAICIILAAVLGGVLGSRSSDDDNKSPSSNGASGIGARSPQSNITPVFPQDLIDSANKAADNGKTDKLGYTATDVYANPVFNGDANTAAPSSGGTVGTCQADPWKASNNVNNPRPGHPRLIAPQYLWDCLESKIQNDAYLTVWNYTIMQNASAYADQDPVTYEIDGGLTLSGILDVSRTVQQRVKAWAYAWRMTRDTKWRDRTMKELQVAAGNTSQPFGDPSTRWDPQHFLDTAEMSAAYAFAYDWMYDAWSDEERANIIDWIVTYGLNPGMQLYQSNQAWWSQPASGNGNWNCVSNGGMIFAALAIQGDAQGNASAVVKQVFDTALPNVKANCMRGVYEDGTWSETPNYWYFGTNAQARLLSALESATGSDQGLMDQNPNWYKTGDFHMYVTGNAGMFAYGDNGPNKFGTTANQLFLYAQKSGNPRYALFQRDRADASSDPLSMFWYDPSTKGAFWNGLALDQWFNNDQGNWFSMRSSWTDMTGNYVAMKASNATGHQTHGDLDAGDFVIDALGTRWAGEYGSDNYLSKNYFMSEDDNADRWKYFRKGTQGQNTLVIGEQNQVSSCKPANKFESSGAKQDGTLDYTPGQGDVAYFVSDLSSCYAQGENQVKRGIRFLNGRRQVLLQDEIKSQTNATQWRVQTNATVTLSEDKKTATMKISQVNDPNAGTVGTKQLPSEVTMVATIVQGPDSAVFAVHPAYNKKENPNYLYGRNQVPQQDTFPAGVIQQQGTTIPAEIPDPEVSVLSIDLPANQDINLQVWWQPQYSDLNDADKAAPKNVQLDDWSLTSH